MAVQSIATSSGTNDSGMFETNLRDERLLPFEGALAAVVGHLARTVVRQVSQRDGRAVRCRRRFISRRQTAALVADEIRSVGVPYPYDIHPDGKRLAVVGSRDEDAAVHDTVVFVFNFFDYLRKIAPETK